jgi:hypothetical protein
VSDPEMRERSRLTMGRFGSKLAVEGPSKRPARSPWTSRARSWPTWRHGRLHASNTQADEHEMSAAGRIVCRRARRRTAAPANDRSCFEKEVS